MQLTGIHHLTAISADAPGNRAFYEGLLGMRLVKKTVNQDDVSAYHLFYADGLASPGTDVTFFEWPVPRERRGTHSIARTALRVAGGEALEWWRYRLGDRDVTVGEIAERDGRLTLDFEDPEGQRLSLVDDGGAGEAHPWEKSAVPAEHQIRGLGPITLSVPDLAPTDAILTAIMNMRPVREYEHPEHPRHTVHVYAMGEGGPAAELHIAVQPRSLAGAAGRRRRAPRRLPHARRRIRCLGRAPRREAHPEQRQGRPLLFPQPLFPRAERHPVRDRVGRSGLCRRRAARDARRAPGAAALPRAAPRGDRGGAEAGMTMLARIVAAALWLCLVSAASAQQEQKTFASLWEEATTGMHRITELDGYKVVERGNAYYYFTEEGHYAHPGVVRRALAERERPLLHRHAGLVVRLGTQPARLRALAGRVPRAQPADDGSARAAVARMERSEMRGPSGRGPDCASLHPGYEGSNPHDCRHCRA